MVSAAQRGENKTVDISRAGKRKDDFSGKPLYCQNEKISVLTENQMPVNISMIYERNGSNPLTFD